METIREHVWLNLFVRPRLQAWVPFAEDVKTNFWYILNSIQISSFGMFLLIFLLYL